MKFIAFLPDKSFFESMGRGDSGRYLFQDKQTSALRIQSPVPSPWGQQWKIVLSPQKQKGDRSLWPYRINLKLFPLDTEGVSARIEREEVKGVFAWAEGQPLAFYAFPVKGKIWIFYSFHKS